MTTNKKKKNNKSNNDTTSKRPTSSSPAGNVSGQGSSISGPLNTPPSTTSTNKRTRVSADDSVMDVDKPLTPPGPVETTSAEIPSQPDTSSLDASQHAPANNNDKGKSPETTPVVSFPERAASLDASQVAVQSQPTLFYALAAPNDVEGFWTHFASNHDTCDTAIKADEHARTLVVTDIPLFITDALLRGTFSRYGNITRCHTRLSKLYRTAYITFESTGALQNLDSTWGVLCGGHCLRICPATFSPDQRAERRAYVALLAGLPRGTIAVDLAEIADEISAKSINVPFSMNSYNPKPYAYCHFASETAMENAKSISCALKKVGLTWHSPDEVISLCHRCGHPNCNPDRCGSSSRPNRPSHPWQSNDKLRALYNKHLPPSHPAKRHNRFARPDNNNDGYRHTSASRHRSNSKSNNRQQSRSRSQYQPWNRDNLNNNNNNQHRRIPDANELDHYADGMDVTYPAPPTVLTDWKSIGTALEKVVEDLALFTTQFVTLNSRITKLESAMAASAPVPGPFVTKPPSYIPSSMQGWDDSVTNTNSNILVDINSPPLQSSCGSIPIPQFAPIPPSNVAPSSPIDMEQRLSSLSNTVVSLAGTIKEGIQQNNFILAHQNGQANY
ncbi:hypothetical protein RirG_150360 [Rhizophagus irregularis DAOM 197198w]|uniref:RRM domain-containing protein n=1 Tax=Rhizophagus irregularis (strain DAOM 197198w) TaxID=1432141 RepID=A0A015J9W2_RHIIW|nr:hypothetical protein RirG_150360 [Rhizophagus irregularis DAOM 197198w]